jgi:uncharacterized membrane protein
VHKSTSHHASSSNSAGTAAGIVIGVLAAVGMGVGYYFHMKKMGKENDPALLKNMSEHGFEDDTHI